MTTHAKTAAQRLSTPVQYLKGVGPRRGKLLERLALGTAADVLFYFPRDYQDLTEILGIDELVEGHPASVAGTVEDVDLRTTQNGQSMLGVLVRQEDEFLRAVWFNQPFLHQRFSVGQRVLLSGKPRLRGGRWEMAHPQVQPLDDQDAPASGQLLPVYGLTEGISQQQMRRIVQNMLDEFTPLLEETFDDAFRKTHRLWPIEEAVRQIHFPENAENLAGARRRFVYQELFLLQLAIAAQRHTLVSGRQATPLPTSTRIDARICRLLPFELTGDQKRAIAEISDDMARDVPMHRLLQGEVGSGKTMVALYAALLAVVHGHQAALMAPTEVLAQQHAETIGRFLTHSQVRIARLTGSLTAAGRRQCLEEIAAGKVDLIIGTQAVVQESVRFHKLGLVVIDEQHKFGVRQRAVLKQAGPSPHYLIMTATPIPRTVTMTIFGDLDVSVLRESPPGRQVVHTYLATEEQRDAWWDFFRRKLREGRQGFVITPLVEESSSVETANLEATFEELSNDALDGFRLAMLHGRMTSAEKAAIMEEFRGGRIQVLVATTVVEVGVDVPNATLMTIEGGNRFGLSQLHQLRGRIARGSQPGFCCVFADAISDEGQRRLEAFVSTNDGFRLAEIDLELRGPGDLLGLRQHGVPPLRIADLVRDRETLEEARHDATQLIQIDPGLRNVEHQRLRRMLLHRYGRVLELGHVG